MIEKSVIITGANGFIGESLVKHFYAKGWNVLALVHNIPTKEIKDVQYIQYAMEGELNESVFVPGSCLIHCAYVRYEKNINADAINISGTTKLISVCRKKNIKIVFLSSFSAHPAAESHYGKMKLKSEKLFNLTLDTVVKSGLVLGKKGLFGEIHDRIKKSTFFPLIGQGLQPIQTIYIDDLCFAIEKILTDNYPGLFHLAEPDAISLKQLYAEQAKQLNKKLIFIPLPVSLMYIICRISEKLGIKLPVSSENIKGLKQLISFETKNDLNRLGITLKAYKESLKLLTNESG